MLYSLRFTKSHQLEFCIIEIKKKKNANPSKKHYNCVIGHIIVQSLELKINECCLLKRRNYDCRVTVFSSYELL